MNRRLPDVEMVVAGLPPETRDSVPARLARFLGHALAGKPREATAALAPEIERMAAAGDMFPRLLAQGYALAGMTEPALHWLTIAVDRGFINHPFLARHDPLLASLRGDARFKELMATVRGRWQRFEA